MKIEDDKAFLLSMMSDRNAATAGKDESFYLEQKRQNLQEKAKKNNSQRKYHLRKVAYFNEVLKMNEKNSEE